MRTQQKYLLALCFSPAAVVAVLGLAILYRQPSLGNLQLVVLASVANLVACTLIYRFLMVRLIGPIQALGKAIPFMTSKDSLADYPQPARQIANAVQQLLADVESKQAFERLDLEQTNARLDKNIAELEQLLKQSVAPPNRHGDWLAPAIKENLNTLTELINVLTSELRGENEISQLIRIRAESLRLFLNVSDDRDGEDDVQTVTFDLRQLSDTVIAAFMMATDVEVLPFFHATDHFAFEGNEAFIKRTLFNYLLTNVRNPTTSRQVDSNAPCHLEVRHTKPGHIAFAATGAGYHAKLLELRATEVSESLWRNPVSAIVFADHSDVERSLRARLATMQVEFQDTSYEADVCIIATTAEAEITAIMDKLTDNTRILLSSNNTAIHHGSAVQLAHPIQHLQLARAMYPGSRDEGPKALVVDDSLASLRAASSLMSDAGYDVITAEDADSAIEAAVTNSLDIILLDLHIPGALDDVQLLERVKSVHDGVPIYILTAEITNEKALMLRAAGAQDILLKPVTTTMIELMMDGADRRKPTRAQRRSGELSIFDEALSLNLASQRADLAEELLEVLMGTIREDREHILNAFETGDKRRFRDLVHRFSGGMRYCGLPRLRDAVEKLSRATAGGKEGDTRLALNVFNSEVARLVEWYDPNRSYFDSSILVRTTNPRE